MAKSATPATVKVTHTELATLLGGLKGATILSLTWTGGESARYKRDHGRIVKVSRCSGMVNARYDRKKAKAAGIPLESVEVAPVNWLDHDAGCISTHNGGKQGASNPKCGTKYITFYPASGGTDYTLDGAPCEREAVKDLLKPSYGGGDKVAFRRVTLTGVSGAVINGTTYEVVADAPKGWDKVEV